MQVSVVDSPAIPLGLSGVMETDEIVTRFNIRIQSKVAYGKKKARASIDKMPENQ